MTGDETDRYVKSIMRENRLRGWNTLTSRLTLPGNFSRRDWITLPQTQQEDFLFVWRHAMRFWGSQVTLSMKGDVIDLIPSDEVSLAVKKVNDVIRLDGLRWFDLTRRINERKMYPNSSFSEIKEEIEILRQWGCEDGIDDPIRPVFPFDRSTQKHSTIHRINLEIEWINAVGR